MCIYMYVGMCNLIQLNTILFIYLEKENDPKVYEELDGVVKSDLFSTTKKESLKLKMSTAVPLAKPLFKSNISPDREKKQAEHIPSHTKSPNESLNEATFNIVASSSELFSTSESSDYKETGKVFNYKIYLKYIYIIFFKIYY